LQRLAAIALAVLVTLLGAAGTASAATSAATSTPAQRVAYAQCVENVITGAIADSRDGTRFPTAQARAAHIKAETKRAPRSCAVLLTDPPQPTTYGVDDGRSDWALGSHAIELHCNPGDVVRETHPEYGAGVTNPSFTAVGTDGYRFGFEVIAAPATASITIVCQHTP
jgi:hypothetical protein